MYSPQYETRNNPRPQTQLPSLQRWSDVVFLDYYDHLARATGKEDTGKEKIPAPKYIFMHEITTPEVKRDMDQLESKLRVTRPAFPGTKYVPGSEGFGICLSTVHGKAIVWFLVQHKLQFGDVAVVAVRAMRIPEEEKNNGYNLLFEIGEGVSGGG